MHCTIPNRLRENSEMLHKIPLFLKKKTLIERTRIHQLAASKFPATARVLRVFVHLFLDFVTQTLESVQIQLSQ